VIKKEIIAFDNSDIDFIAIKQMDQIGFSIEIGVDFIYLETEDSSDEEVVAWALEYGFSDEELADPENNLDNLRALKARSEEEYHHLDPPSYATPHGRAFDYFHNLDFFIPEHLGINIIEGLHPGNDWLGVTAENFESLISLQTVLLDNGIKANFDIK
jgi:hypothetical protein